MNDFEKKTKFQQSVFIKSFWDDQYPIRNIFQMKKIVTHIFN